MSDEQICPLRNDVCLGRRCALAMKAVSPDVDVCRVWWTCGLITTYNSYNHGHSPMVDSEESEW